MSQSPSQGGEGDKGAKKGTKPMAPPAMPVADFDVSKFVDREEDLEGDKLMLDIAPNFPYGQMRGIDEEHVTLISEDQMAHPPYIINLTVWPHRRMPLLLWSVWVPSVAFI
jgi:hypothetical protein